MINIKWNEYTWYSKLVAAVFFLLILPVWFFYLGMKYKEITVLINDETTIDSFAEYKHQKSQTKVFTDTTNVPSDMKVYKNAKYGFEFQYPSEMSLYEDDNNPNGDHLRLVITNFQFDPNRIYRQLPSNDSIMFSFNVGKESNNPTLFLHQKSEFQKGVQNFLVDGIPAIKTIYPKEDNSGNQPPLDVISVQFFDKNQEFIVYGGPLKQESLFMDVLSTVKMIK